MRSFFAVISLLIGLAAAPAQATIVIEDFLDSNGNGAFDPTFNHDFSLTYPGGGADFWAFDPQGLRLHPEVDRITFNLGAGQWVDAVRVTVSAPRPGLGNEAYVVLYGTDLAGNATSATVDVAGADHLDVVSDSFGLDSISMIDVVMGLGFVHEIKIDFVPEPTAATLLAAGCAALGLMARRTRAAR